MSKINWLVQNIGFSQTNLDLTEETLNKMHLPYLHFGISRLLNFVINLENILIDPDIQFIVRGGTSILSLLNNIDKLNDVNPNLSEFQIQNSEQFIANLKNGIFYDEKSFDQAYYSTLNLPLLNNDAKKYPIKDYLNSAFNSHVFIKPSRDQKAFSPGILEPGQTIKEFIFSQIHEDFYLDEIAIIAPVKKIFSEYRFFVVNQEIITGSQYRNDKNLFISDIIPPQIFQCAKEYAKLYQPHDIFTMDLANTPDGIKIIEYNCWNASGLYKTNVQKIFNEVHEFQIHKISHKNQQKP